jgi:hypothetical protein
MKYLIPAIVAVVSLCATSAQACNPVAIVAPQQAFYAAPVYAQQIVAAPVVYQAQVQAVNYAAPLQLAIVDNHHCRQAVRVQRQRFRNRVQRQQVNVNVGY